jgi:hypothetical protein
MPSPGYRRRTRIEREQWSHVGAELDHRDELGLKVSKEHGVRLGEALFADEGLALALQPHCPGQKPPKRAVKRPARPYKSSIQNQFAM